MNYAAMNVNTSGDLYVLELSLGGRVSLALIDSGATANFINEEVVPDSAEIDSHDAMTVQGFDGNQTETKGAISTDAAAVANNRQFSSIKLHVVAKSPFPIVLGTPFLRQFRLAIDVSEEVLTSATGDRLPLVRISGDYDRERGFSMSALQSEESPWKPSDDVTICGGPDEIEQLRRLIDEEFQDCFDFGDSHVGAITDKIGIYHYIDTGDARPYARPPIRMSPQERAMTREYRDEKLASGAISPAPPGTEWAAPVLWVKKPGGGMRFCQDYRGINAVTVKDKTRCPEVIDIMDTMAGCTHFSKMDWAASFNQIRVWPPHLQKTGFITPFGLFVTNVLNFGPTGGPATLQATANAIMGDLLAGPTPSTLTTLSAILRARFQITLRRCGWDFNDFVPEAQN